MGAKQDSDPFAVQRDASHHRRSAHDETNAPEVEKSHRTGFKQTIMILKRKQDSLIRQRSTIQPAGGRDRDASTACPILPVIGRWPGGEAHNTKETMGAACSIERIWDGKTRPLASQTLFEGVTSFDE